MTRAVGGCQATRLEGETRRQSASRPPPPVTIAWSLLTDAGITEKIPQNVRKLVPQPIDSLTRMGWNDLKAAQNGHPTRPRTKLEAVFSSRHRMSTVASHRNIPILTISVAVVRKMLEAVAGSAPSFFSARGISAPDSPLVTQLATMARKTTIASIRPFSWWWMVV